MVCSVKGEAGRQGIARVTRVVVMIGELQQIERDIFRFALEQVLRSYDWGLGPDVFELKVQKAELVCNVCGRRWEFAQARKALDEGTAESVHFVPELAHAFIRCPDCSSPDFRIDKGRGVWIESMEGEA